MPPPDKLAHFALGTCVAGVGSVHSVALGAFLLTLVAVVKEVWDWASERGTPDALDIVWTLLGGLPVLIPLTIWRLA